MLERNRGRVSVSIRNTTNSPVEVPARVLLGWVHQATPVAPSDLEEDKKIEDLKEGHQTDGAELPPEWRERVKAQLDRWQKIFSKTEFDFGCAKSATHRIRLKAVVHPKIHFLSLDPAYC